MNDEYRVLTSLEELKFEGLIDFHFHWDQLRGERLAPQHWEFDVLDLPNIVRSLSIFRMLDNGNDAQMKFNGQSVVDHVGRDSTGQLFKSHILDPLKERALGMFQLVISSKQPVVSGPRIPVDTLNKTGQTQVLALPLLEDARIAEIVTMVATEPQ